MLHSQAHFWNSGNWDHMHGWGAVKNNLGASVAACRVVNICHRKFSDVRIHVYGSTYPEKNDSSLLKYRNTSKQTANNEHAEKMDPIYKGFKPNIIFIALYISSLAEAVRFVRSRCFQTPTIPTQNWDGYVSAKIRAVKYLLLFMDDSPLLNTVASCWLTRWKEPNFSASKY